MATAKDDSPDSIKMDTPCDIWTGYIDSNGYGVTYHNRTKFVHRHVYEQAHGPIPEGFQIDHLCRNRACRNLLHLELVPQIINIQRGAKAKLTAAQVLEIRERHANGEAIYGLNFDYHVSEATIRKIVKKERWANL